ncbi:MAG TPA: ribosome-associated translation inhibitor RaiA [Gemmatimonadales bacterium]|jgi:ribosomal subunit interface protein|nr:ribosome-associated translation inhibitor RaiA [Gemmatimonadales bacterium]
MHTTITARHCEIPDALRARAAEVCARLERHASRPVDCSVTFDVGRLAQTAELRLHLSGGEVLVATGEGSDHRSALDRAEERLRRQLERVHVHPARQKATEAPEA